MSKQEFNNFEDAREEFGYYATFFDENDDITEHEENQIDAEIIVDGKEYSVISDR